jgi:hypothetical protein
LPIPKGLLLSMRESFWKKTNDGWLDGLFVDKPSVPFLKLLKSGLPALYQYGSGSSSVDFTKLEMLSREIERRGYLC